MTMTKFGNIKLTVTKQQLDMLDFKDYFACYRQTAEVEKYYHEHNSSIWQMFDESPAWVHDLARMVPQDFSAHEVSVISIPPGQTIPYHQDKHYLLQQRHGPGDTWRYLIFLEPWQSGHYFELDGRPIINWQTGDWIKFHRSLWHLAGNMGTTPFYTAQVTVK